MRTSRFRCGAGVLALVAASQSPPSFGTETITYTYDALGRLVAAQSTGSVNNSQVRSSCYDSAGNRTQYRSDNAGGFASCSGGAPAPTPTPTPTPTPGPSFSINDVSGTEGAALVFTITRAGVSSGSYSVTYATASGSATTQDYNSTSGTLTFASGQMSLTLSVVTKADIKAEGTEIFYVNLSNPSGGATISDSQGIGTIFNDGSVCTTC